MTVPTRFAYEQRFAAGLPAPTPRFGGLARYVLNSGHNDPEMIPAAALAKAAAAVIAREGRKLAIYNLAEGPLGYSGLRRFFADKLKLRGITTTPEQILITSGSGQGIEFALRLLVQPGDTVLYEEFSYMGAINKARSMGAEVVPVPVDADGLRSDALETILSDLKARGIVPKLIYTIPTVQNPTGTIMPLDRRQEVIRVARAHGVPIFEDECYADIVWAPGTPPALYGMAPEEVIHIGTLSKTLAPALRVGYVAAPWAVLSQMLSFKNDGGTGALDQMVAAEYFSTHFDSHIAALSVRLKRKCDVMIAALEREFGASARIWKPAGGIFVWVDLDGPVDTRDLVEAATAGGLVFNPGPEWAVDGSAHANSFRLCFALPTETEIEEGVALLAEICHAQTGIPARGANRIRARE